MPHVKPRISPISRREALDLLTFHRAAYRSLVAKNKANGSAADLVAFHESRRAIAASIRSARAVIARLDRKP